MLGTRGFTALCVANFYAVGWVACKVKMVRNVFRNIFFIFSIFTEMFVNGFCKFPACFFLVDLLAKRTGISGESRDESSHGGNLNHHQLV